MAEKQNVTVTVDRPLGSVHPRCVNIVYTVNYGFVAGVPGGDGAEQDAYILGVDMPMRSFTGRVIAVIHRRDDVEDKWVVAPPECHYTAREIAQQVRFVEQYFDTWIEMIPGEAGENIMNGLVIRNETERDYRPVEELTREAFWNHHAPGCEEHYLAHVLRGKPDFVKALDLVAERDGQLVGSVMYAVSRLTDETGRDKAVLTFGPLSVLPACQRQGVGKALLAESFRRAVDMGYDAVVIFGHPGNYVSRGFRSCQRYQVSLPGGVYPTAMLVKELKAGALDDHSWVYTESAAYEYDPAEVAAFDAGFPPKEKRYEPCQEEFYIYSRSRIL